MSRLFQFLPFAPAAALVTMLAAAAAGPDDDPERIERLEVGQMAFRDNCQMCHAEEMTTRLRLTEKQWATEIDKMIGWGAPVPLEHKGPLLEYLVSAFSNPATSPVAAPDRITFRAAVALIRPEGRQPSGGDSNRGAALFTTHCATCHGPEARGGDLGTCLIQKPILQRPADYSTVVSKGLRRMPGFAAALKPEQEADILAWLRSRRFEAPAP